MTGRKVQWVYQESARKGDHICYISDLRKFQAHYPAWSITRNLNTILEEIIESGKQKQPVSVG
jgi:CDP-paratose 2-epimerase